MRAGDISSRLQGNSIAPLWFITGEEPLVMIEAAEAVRDKAKELGFEEREVMNASALWDWSLLEASCREVGLFSPKKVIDLRLASFRPGIKGAKALSDLSEMPLDNVVVIVSMPYDWSVKKLAWFKKLAVAAQFVECAPITARELPSWIKERFSRQGQSVDNQAVTLLCERCEGNLLAAKQELLKLSYQYPVGTRISAEMIRESVSDVSRFDSEALAEALLTGNAAKAVKIIDSLKAEGESIPNVLWMLADEIRGAARVNAMVQKGLAPDAAMRSAGIFGPAKTRRVRTLALRCSEKKLQAAVMLLSDIDKIGKGLTVAKRDADPWLELAGLAAFLRR